MNTRRFLFLAVFGSFSVGAGWLAGLHAQQLPQFSGFRRLTNNEIALTLSAPTGMTYQIDATMDLADWSALVTLPTNTTTSLQYTDSAAPYLDGRFYRATGFGGSNVVSGDHLATTNGDVIIHPLFHASLVLSWNGITIYNDPTVDPVSPAIYEPTYLGLPKADLILISHSHSDHFNTAKINSLRQTNTVIIVPQTVYTGLTAAQKTNAIVLAYGASTNVLGLTVEAVYAYNSNHSPLGFGNGYVVTIGGKRLYLSGDTGDAPQIDGLTNIDVAFLCMNIPYTMTARQATNAVRTMRPRIVYPYHYRDQSNAITNAAWFKQLLGTDAGIEVRLRKWY